MGQALSTRRRAASEQGRFGAPGSAVKHRVQLLEELVAGPGDVDRRQQLLQQLTPEHRVQDGSQPAGVNYLPSAPEEFKLGCLIAAGSYGRVYAGMYCGRPAALKLLILDEDSAAAILNEVRLCLKLNHQNLVRLLDCAVVSTASRHAQGSQDVGSSNWLLDSRSAVLPPLVHTGLGPAAHDCSYLPFISGQQQQQAGGWDHVTGSDLLHAQDAAMGHGPSLVSAAGHACFEVWIAMELCDGGTLAEQVQQGFLYLPESRQADMELLLSLALDIARALTYMHAEHVCHGDLKSENVLLKSLDLSSEGASSCSSSCWGEECSWLSLLCSSGSSSSSGRCRRCSSDSCWSCCSKLGGKAEPSGSASSTVSSPNSSPVSEGHRGGFPRPSSRSSNLLSLSGLCCLASSRSCLDDDCDPLGAAAAAASTAAPAELACSPEAAAAPQPPDSEVAGVLQLQPDLQPLLFAGWNEAGSFVPFINAAPAAGSTAGSEQPWLQLADAGALAAAAPAQPRPPRQQQQQQQQQPGQPRRPSQEEPGEEELVAPLSLYAARREHRRSRRLSHTSLVSMQAALAAAAAATMGPADPLAPGLFTSSSGSEDDGAAEAAGGDVSNVSSAAASAADSQQVASATNVSAAGSTLSSNASTPSSQASFARPDAAAAATAAAGFSLPTLLEGFPASPLPLSVVPLQPLPRAHAGARGRRHSYCCGASSASYDVMCLPISQAAAQAGLQRQAPGSISAAEAAAAIAAAADQLKVLSAPRGGGSRRSGKGRRMSFDDRLLRLSGKGPASALPLLASLTPRSSADAAAAAGSVRLGRAVGSGPGRVVGSGQAAPAGGPAGRKARRHSWTCLGFEDAGVAWSLRSLTSLLMPQEQQQQQQSGAGEAAWLLGSSLDEDEGASNSSSSCSMQRRKQLLEQCDSAASCSLPRPGNSSAGAAVGGSSTRRAPRTRRHSWAGFGSELLLPSAAAQAADTTGSASAKRGPGRRRRLSSCFAPGSDATVGDDDGGGGSSWSGSPRRPTLFHLRSCCGDSSYLPLDDSDDAADTADEQQALAAADDGAQQLCSSLLPGLPLSDGGAGGEAWQGPDGCAVAISCLGRWAAGSGTGTAAGRRGRRSSWCCSTTGLDDALLEPSACSNSSCVAAAAAGGGGGALSSSSSREAALRPSVGVVSSLPAVAAGSRRARRTRRCSWDGVRLQPAGSMPVPALAAAGAEAAKQGALLLQQQPCNSAAEPWLLSCGTTASSPHTPVVQKLLLQQQQQADSLRACPAGPADNAAAPACTPPNAPVVGISALQAGHAAVQQHQQQQHQQQQHHAYPPAQLQVSPAADSACWLLQPAADACRQQSAADPTQLHATDTDTAGSSSFLRKGSAAVAASQPGGPAGSGSTLSTGFATEQQQLASAVGELPHFGRVCSLDKSRDLAMDGPFLGSFGLMRTQPGTAGSDSCSSLRRNSPCNTATSSCSFASKLSSQGSRERRWSTGVAAHDLLLRQRSLESCSSQQQQLLQQSLDQADSACDAEPGSPGSILRAAISSFNSSVMHSPASAASLPTAPRAPAAAAGLSQVPVNVLGMPPRPAAVINQRRMSYDTATGSYLLVSSQELVCAGLQQQDQQLEDQQAGQAESQLPLADQLQQASQMRRLLEALARRGHNSGVPALPSFDEVPASDAASGRSTSRRSSNSAAAAMAASQLQLPWQPQQQQPQQQQRGAAATAPGGRACVDGSGGAAAGGDMPQRPRFCAKLCDFGFSQCLRVGQSHASGVSAGTITHQAPEVLIRGMLSPAADVYSFGVILWELLTGERPFRGMLEGDVVLGVCERGLRPAFPPGAPQAYVALAQQCWAEDPSERPTAAQLVKRLNELLYEERRRRQLKGSAGGWCYGSTATGSAHGGCRSSRQDRQRQRRHSMPEPRLRQRRLSRRLSLFLPFSRQPAVPEHAPLEQEQLASSVSSFPAASRNQPGAVLAAAPAAAAAAEASADSSAGSSHLRSVHSSAPANISSPGQTAPRGTPVWGSQGTASHSASGALQAATASGVAAASGPGNSDGSEWFQSFD